MLRVKFALVPPGVVTVVVRGPGAALGSTVRLTTRKVVLVALVTLFTVTPVPLTATVVAPKV